MNSQPFDPFEPFNPEAQAEPGTTPTQPAAPNPFFDRPGLLWILACVAIAVAAGHWIPRLTEPGVAGWMALASGAMPKDKAAPGEPARPSPEASRPVKPSGQLKQEIF